MSPDAVSIGRGELIARDAWGTFDPYMLGTARRPSAEELEELIELTGRDPGSPAFVDLGDAYLALGRPKEAIDVGARGLRANPHNVEGRMMVSRAFVMQHQWKQAQAELLKVVKSDRSHAPGFLLLGEVLMRRGDYERALPVLQHAQNLDPANPKLLDLLRRVRNRQPLDAPEPIPVPQEPEQPAGYGAPGGYDSGPSGFGGHGAPQPISPRAAPIAPTMAASAFVEEEPTSVAPPMLGGMGGQPHAGMGPMDSPVASPNQATVLQRADVPAMPPAAAMPPPAMEPPARPSARDVPPPGAPNVRPRVLPAQKPKDAAQAGLRQSAAVGENYLNNLLTAGLLDMPNVNAPEAAFELKSGKRWGRSTRRAFIFLFILLFFGIGGGSGWYYLAQQQRDREVALLLEEAQGLIESASYEDLQTALTSPLRKALDQDKGNARIMANIGLATGLRALLYGTPADDVEFALTTARRDIGADSPEYRKIVLADVSATLAQLPAMDDPKTRLQDARQRVEEWLDGHADDHWARWLHGITMQRAGDLEGAMVEFKRAAADDAGPVIATISAADLLLDDGKLDEARKRYEQALERSPDHPLAQIGLALLSSEASTVTEDDTLGTLNVMKEDVGPRINSYRFLARAMAAYSIGQYAGASENLDKAKGVREPRFLARVALTHLAQGDLVVAASARKKIRWYGESEPKANDLVVLFDAGFLLARGLPRSAFQKLKTIEGLRAQELRGRALYDQGTMKDAIEEFERAIEKAPDNFEIAVWREAARLVGDARARREAGSALDSLARRSTNKLVRVAHGDALIRGKEIREARKKLLDSLDNITPEEPNPMAYRAHTLIADLDIRAKNLNGAAQNIARALEQVPGYLPAIVLRARVALLREDFKGAAQDYRSLIDEAEIATAEVELGYAESLVSLRGNLSEDVRNLAREAVRRAKQKGASPEDLGRVAQKVDPALLEEFGVAAPR